MPNDGDERLDQLVVTTARPIVYVPMSGDLIHPGHIDNLRVAATYGTVIVGLLTDAAIEAKKAHLPVLGFGERLELVSALRLVDHVVPQLSPDYRPNLLLLRPEYVVHGDDWPEMARRAVVDTIASWSGTLVETDYGSRAISSSSIRSRVLLVQSQVDRPP